MHRRGRDSGKHAFSVIEGLEKSFAMKGRGVSGEGAPWGTAGWDSGKHAFSVVEAAVKSLAIKGRGVWGEGAHHGTGRCESQAGLGGPKCYKIIFRKVFL